MKKWALTCVTVADIDGALEGTTEQNSDDSLASVLSDTIVVVDDAEKNQRMNNDLLDGPR